MKQLLAPVLLLATAGGLWFWLRSDGDSRQPNQPPPTTKPGTVEPASPSQQAVVPPPVAAPAKKGRLLLPDGSTVEALNGVQEPPKLLWDAPEWFPIIGVERHGKLDWYKHANGSYSTTFMTFRSDLGRDDATTISLHPLQAAPTAPLDAADMPPVGR